MTELRNGGSVPRASVSEIGLTEFREAILVGVAAGERVLALFGACGELWVVLGAPATGTLRLARTPLPSGAYPSLTPACPEVHLFERELAETCGVAVEGHPWLKPVRNGVTEFYRVEGDEVHEVAVGPVHAGVIEPGHFRFQCHGERVFHLEIVLGYQHRGVERALVGGPTKRTLPLVETLCGDSSVAHGIAYAEIVEGLAGVVPSPRAVALRGVALELERLANHTGDLGALAGDVGFLPTASFCGRLRGDWLNLTALACGNRFGRSWVVPGGVRFDLEPGRVATMRTRVATALGEVAGAAALLWETPSVMARFEDTGTVGIDVAREVGLVGLAARASGLERDARVDFPSGAYRFHQVPLSSWGTGDVFARAWVRWLEIERSAAFVDDELRHLVPGDSVRPVPGLGADRVGVAVVEGWRGEVCHVAITDGDGRFAAYKVVDPSFHNWMGLALALRDQQISDFPLCNKSFNLSYCGHDL